ncbi:MAG: YbaK/EbsC family protein [Phycisphaerae bacterium]|nr:YbaK/EbsC family protein [Phycisphaerae bacterium]
MHVTDYLKEHKVGYQLRSHRPTYTSQEMAAEEHVSGMNIAKPVIVQADGRYYMCVLPACCKVDLEALRSGLGAGEVQLADEREMAKLFPDCELGAEPPFGNMFDLATIMDETMVEGKFIVFQAGRHNQAIKVDMKDYQNLVRPRIMNFSYHLH